MSKQMRSAYSALRMKDTLVSVLAACKPTILVLVSMALLCCNTAIFQYLAVAAAVAAGIWSVIRILAFALNLRMRMLGFDEIELERLALA